ncbi:Asp-tRNA(Asn)/Glu-tRNA(Gln) amidotransferase GatCAB subunit B [Candidatus Pacearchaeota archaeon]|nr:MAG: Asp-tRNA(Asn)/Glu-tRNA(Gln) amidotransferase GatCAB subunit B [Candidatus Pacearchaeota archaeon]
MPKIGLEIHGYLNTKEKLFCRCKAIHGTKHASPNTNICPICTGQPGAKPMLPNKQAIDKVIRIALVLGCKINTIKKEVDCEETAGVLHWQRKHYDWPDLPKGYQNTISGTHAIPIGKNGKFLKIRIKECHLEEDPAAWNPQTGEIDYNRSGSPLVEIVTEPDFKSSEQVIDWIKQLIHTLSYIKAFDKKSGIKADVNISLPEIKGERVEIKNVNSLKNIQNAIEYEIQRQKKEKQKTRETRMFNETAGVTKKMREKEQAQDYRFISDPDLPVINIKKIKIKKIKSSLPETPQKKLDKIIKKYNINKKSAEILTKKIEVAEFFEKVIEKINPKLATRWVTEELLSVLNYNKKELDDPEINIKPEHFIELLKLLEKGTITELKAKEILRKFIPNSFSPKKEAEKSQKISEKNKLEKICQQIIKENPKAVMDYKAGEHKALNFLIGKVMQKTNKRADYLTTRKILENKLK